VYPWEKAHQQTVTAMNAVVQRPEGLSPLWESGNLHVGSAGWQVCGTTPLLQKCINRLWTATGDVCAGRCCV